MNKKIIWGLLIGIIVLAAVLRLWQLGNIPPSPDWDEVALGYDAYSFIHTGRDEFGKFLPVVLRSFDDYKPALYAYLTVPSVLAFGLTVFAVRFPSAIFGILSVLAVFYLVRELFENYKYKDQLSLISSFCLAISPWSIQFSRVGFESNVGTALNIFMALFFLKGIKKPWLLSISAIFAGLAIYAYQSEKVFTPLLALALVLIYRKKLFPLSKKFIFSAFAIGIIVILPMVLYTFTDSSSFLRLKGTSIFSYQTQILKSQVQDIQRDQINNDKLGTILDNRRITYAKTIIQGYIVHFDPNWLFITGDIERHHAPNMGLLYLYELPFLLLGLYFLFFGDFDKKSKVLICTWLLLAPLPASITAEVPHAVRTLNFLPTFQIIVGLGIFSFFLYISKFKRLKYLCFLIFAGIFIFNFSYYLDQYFVQLNFYDSSDWQYGYKQAVDEVKLLQGEYNQVVVSDTQPMDKSYMFFLFYLQYSPSEYQKIEENSSGDYVVNHSFSKYVFRPIDWQKDSKLKNTLFVGPPDEIPNAVSKVTINNLNGTPAIRIART